MRTRSGPPPSPYEVVLRAPGKTRPGAYERDARDRLIPAVIAASLWVTLFGLALMRWRATSTGVDIAIFAQAAWLIGHGKPPFVTIGGFHILGDHASFLLYPLSLPARFLPPVPYLLALQSAALASAIVPLYAIARRVAGLGVPAAALVSLLYAVHPAVQMINLSDLHLEAFLIPALLGAYLFGRERRTIPFVLCVGVALAAKEDFGLAVAALGLLLVSEGARRAGLGAMVVGAAWSVVAVEFVLKPHFGGEYRHATLLAHYGSSPLGVLRGVIGDPSRVFSDLTADHKIYTLLGLLVPVLLLPLLSPRHLIPAVPSIALNFLSLREMAHTLDWHYTAGMMTGVFIATTMGMRWLGRIRGRPVTVLLLIPALLVVGIWSRLGFMNSPGAELLSDKTDVARKTAARMVTPDAPVSATDRMLPFVAGRENVYQFPRPLAYWEPREDEVDAAARQEAVRFLLLDTADRLQWNEALEGELRHALAMWGFELLYESRGIMVFERRAGPSQPGG